MWNVVELFQIGAPGDWVVDLDQAELVVKMLTRRSQLGSNSMLGAPDQRSLGGMIIVQIGIGRSLVKGYEKEIAMRESVNAPMTELVIVIQEKRGTTIEIGTRLGTGTEQGTGKEIMGVTVIVIVVIEIGTEIVVGIMIERGTAIALMIAIVREAGTVREITSVQVTKGTVVTCMRGMLIMPMVRQSMTEIWLTMGRTMAMTNMSNTRVMRDMVMVKMDVGMKLSVQSDMSMSIIRRNLTMQNLKALRKARHTRKVTTSIRKLRNTRTET